MEFVKVFKGSIETSINKKQLNHYLENGWKEVKEVPKEQPKTYDNYTVAQLKGMCENRKLLVNSKDKKKDIIDKLLTQDEMNEKVSYKPTNKGFTDNLIIE